MRYRYCVFIWILDIHMDIGAFPHDTFPHDVPPWREPRRHCKYLGRMDCGQWKK